MSETSLQMEKLLNNVAGLLKAREAVYRVTGEKFNIFRILNIGEGEFFICKVLEELFSPSGSHYQGSLFLRPFVKNVLGLNIPDTELERAEVYRQHYTSEGRYIDIVIKTANYFIAIEVKINTGDLNGQCRDYYEEAKQHCADENNAKIIYLTPDGRKPSPESACGKEICISFKKDIREWLLSCLSLKEIEYAVPVREIMRQFLMTIESFTGQTKEDNMEVEELIMRSPESLRTVFKLTRVANKAVEDLRIRFLEAVDERLKEKYNITPGTFTGERSHALHYKYDKMPGVVVCLGSSIGETYVSYYTTEYDNTQRFESFVNKLQETRGKNFDSHTLDKRWPQYLYWENYHVDGKGSPNLYGPNPNDATFELCTPEKFDAFVEVCAEMIKEFLEFSPE